MCKLFPGHSEHLSPGACQNLARGIYEYSDSRVLVMTLENGYSQGFFPITFWGFQAQGEWWSPQMLLRRLRWVFKIVFLLVRPDNPIRNFKICLPVNTLTFTRRRIINLQISMLCCIFSTLSPVATSISIREQSQKCFSSQ